MNTSFSFSAAQCFFLRQFYVGKCNCVKRALLSFEQCIAAACKLNPAGFEVDSIPCSLLLGMGVFFKRGGKWKLFYLIAILCGHQILCALSLFCLPPSMLMAVRFFLHSFFALPSRLKSSILTLSRDDAGLLDTFFILFAVSTNAPR